MKCLHCDEFMSRITSLNVLLSDGEEVETANLHVCTSRDCSHCGIVMAMPIYPKD